LSTGRKHFFSAKVSAIFSLFYGPLALIEND
jgi:hypothetical protein